MPTPQNDLILALFEGILGEASWDSFLKGLLARTGADRVHLLSSGGSHRIARREWADGEDATGELAALERSLSLLRPNRIYAMEELRDFDRKDVRAVQDELLAAARIGDARIVRIGQRKASAWLILLAERIEFTSADSALLAGVVPAVEIALAQLAVFRTWRNRAEAAEGSLALLGIGQAVLDEGGSALTADDLWPTVQKAPLEVPALAGGSDDRAVVRAADGRPVLLRRAAASSALIASFRLPRREAAPRAAQIVAATLGLSKREAALAVLLSQGHSLIEAGRMLSLSDETTRSYSKRIYAKTGARGQGDLVRLVLTGLAPLG